MKPYAKSVGKGANDLPPDLCSAIEAETASAVHPAAEAMAAAIAGRHSQASLGVIFYGSCLRDDRVLRGEADGVLDFYLVVDDYRSAYDRLLPRIANRLLPPNVFYLEHEEGKQRLRAKYAVISLRQLERGVSARSFNSSLWARFAQPTRILASRDKKSADRIRRCLTRAPVTLISETAPLLSGTYTPEEIWIRAFEETYASELRSEGRRRARELVHHDAERYRRLTSAALAAAKISYAPTGDGLRFGPATAGAAWRWQLRRIQGKALSVLRLVKGAFTFDGGLEYLMWKIERHSGVRVPVSDWQRRHPLLAAPGLTWRLYRRGAFR
jgi:hypothetical protein